jgi:hypothetical protein
MEVLQSFQTSIYIRTSPIYDVPRTILTPVQDVNSRAKWPVLAAELLSLRVWPRLGHCSEPGSGCEGQQTNVTVSTPAAENLPAVLFPVSVLPPATVEANLASV